MTHGAIWNWPAFFLTAGFVLFSALAAASERTFRPRAGLDLAFVQHPGMWSDLIVLSSVNALVTPHIAAWLDDARGFGLFSGLSALLLCLAAAAVSTAAAHAAWYRGTAGGRPWADHLWPRRPRGSWIADLSAAGWMHLVYMTGQLALILAFAITPVPGRVAGLVSALLALHVVNGLVLPAYVVTGRPPAGPSCAMLAGSLAAVLLVALLKVS